MPVHFRLLRTVTRRVWCSVDLKILPHHPSRKALANEWLDLYYDEVKTEARATWLNEEYINTIMDESTDALGNRIINLSFVTRLECFYVETEACGANTQSAEYLAAWYKAGAINVLGPEKWWRVNSLATDTCSTSVSSERSFSTHNPIPRSEEEPPHPPPSKHDFVYPCQP